MHARRIIEFHRAGLPPHRGELDALTRNYIEIALEDFGFTEREQAFADDREEPDYSWESLAPQTMQRMVADCKKFQAEAGPIIDAAMEASHETGEPSFAGANPYTRAGSDFWLTRNGHGAGFMDGHWGDFGRQLADIAHKFGSADLYAGDDGKIYQGGAEGDWQLSKFKAPGAPLNSRGGAIQNVKVKDDKFEPESPSDGLEWPRNFGVDD